MPHRVESKLNGRYIGVEASGNYSTPRLTEYSGVDANGYTAGIFEGISSFTSFDQVPEKRWVLAVTHEEASFLIEYACEGLLNFRLEALNSTP